MIENWERASQLLVVKEVAVSNEVLNISESASGGR